MSTFQAVLAPLALLIVGAACGGGTTGPNPNPGTLPTPSAACAAAATSQLSVGQHLVVDPSVTSGCLRLPQAGASGAQYLLVLTSTSGVKSSIGVSGPYLIRGSNPGAVTAAPAPDATAPEGARAVPRASAAREFDAMLRQREQELLALPGARIAPGAAAPFAPPPVFGDVKDFKVCSNLTCSAFTTVQATVRYVGAHSAVYIDNTVPQNDPLTQADFDNLGTTFDTYHYPIDTTAFGRESDIDANGVVEILMTDAVNALTPDCTTGRVVGYFFGGDLLNNANSNRGEVFYTLVPTLSTPTCPAIPRQTAVDNLKPTLIHEFQHMISFNQHALIRGGSGEEVWLNEALSHFAEELGGRQIPSLQCAPTFTSCRSQYTSSDIFNAYDFLKDTEREFMIFPSSASGTLAQRGAVWMFLRWTLDQFAADTILGTDVTRALVQTQLTGATNLTTVTGGSLSTMIPQWLMAAYLDDGTDLPVESTGRLRYKSWGLRAIWTDPRNASSFPAGFPLAPDVIGGTYTRAGTLKAGSGRHFVIVQAAQGAALDLQVLKNSAGDPLDPALVGRFGIVRIR